MKILIVGGGVAGTALAGFLSKTKKHDVTIIDSAPAWGDIGYVIALWGNGRKILKKIGIEDEIYKKSYEVPWNVFEDQSGNVLAGIYFKAFSKYGETIITTRTTLHNALVGAIHENTTVNFNTTITAIEDLQQTTLVTFNDGRTEEYDLVVGADGIHSKVRELYFGKEYLKYYGWNIWVFWSPLESHTKGIIVSAGKGCLYGLYPTQDKCVVTLAVDETLGSFGDVETRKERLLDMFKDFKTPISTQIKNIDSFEEIFRDRLAYVDMDDWYKNRVVLVGDAQHATSPVTGMGASLALEDAYVLAQEISKVESTNVAEALLGYEKRRRKRLRDFRTNVHIVEEMIMTKSSTVSALRKILLKLIPVQYFVWRLSRVLQAKI